jgi:hypothetical protein
MPLFFSMTHKKIVAEGERFELSVPFGTPVFKTGAFNHSATPPKKLTTSHYYANEGAGHSAVTCD